MSESVYGKNFLDPGYVKTQQNNEYLTCLCSVIWFANIDTYYILNPMFTVSSVTEILYN